MNENNYVVIMAGGIGSRFWPYSRQDHPKQFIDILGTGKSLLQHTVDRFKNICPIENVYVVTNESYGDLVSEQLPDISSDQILLEPIKRNTAPCIGYSCYKIAEKNPSARIIVSPSDHAIFNETKFEEAINESIDGLENSEALITIGIKPSRPETGYGYIQFFNDKNPLKKVKTFTEKPNIELATKFVESGEFVWNAGIFIWSASAIIKAFGDFLPEMAEVFEEAKKSFYTEDEQEAINKAYSHCRNISIDYGIMEKADNVYVMATEFGWNDLGTWGSLFNKLNKDEQGNALVNARAIFKSSSGNMVSGPPGKRIVIQGLDNFIVVDTEDTLLIFPKAEEQSIKEVSKEAESKLGNS